MDSIRGLDEVVSEMARTVNALEESARRLEETYGSDGSRESETTLNGTISSLKRYSQKKRANLI